MWCFSKWRTLLSSFPCSICIFCFVLWSHWIIAFCISVNHFFDLLSSTLLSFSSKFAWFKDGGTYTLISLFDHNIPPGVLFFMIKISPTVFFRRKILWENIRDASPHFWIASWFPSKPVVQTSAPHTEGFGWGIYWYKTK